MTNAPELWHDDLALLWQEAWHALSPSAPQTPPQARRVVLSTLDAEGAPQARILVLRHARADTAIVEMHTDAATPKVAQIARDPRASLTFWDESRSLQLRLTGRVSVITGAQAQTAWDAVPAFARANYGVEPIPGQTIATPAAFARTPDPARFAVLRFGVDTLDAVVLCDPQHRRAFFERSRQFSGVWCAP
ncbi:pyridoxamine 5'-phosphate oxidase [Aquimixticola soesokkakensis]|uniref:Pyridoxamine 5'-phosphate oxidase n=1 Tax=Aquimixticola soesokkakensis TaxID=1519096 RepID=A0A1Y5TR33_9RHOB|nr:pyridoxamine 5'-phosphate oxidase family protein [Aquimixticola soesokkakensis]SLN66264.1 pyridoxamine 5'-phosphate oxidase [Aquimixticola soesokkakensis]